jgi:formylglycine-generating enzyme required for sulfatase activity
LAPVAVHPVPVQLPIVMPMSITAQPESAFADLGADEAGPDVTEADHTAALNPLRKKSGGKGMLIAAAVAVLLTVVAGGVVVSQLVKKSGSKVKAPGDTSDLKPPTPAGPLPSTYKNSIGMEFVKVPKGTGWLGGGGGKEGETKVVIERDFYLGKYEVTQAEWEAVMQKNPSFFSRTGPGKDTVKDISDADLNRFPVEGVSWDDCQLFIERLNKKEKEAGWVYRLPKDAEWEYACRGGPVDRLDSAFDFYFARPTNMIKATQANIAAESDGKGGLGRTCKVGSYQPNPLGLYDMHGNVQEWCEDAATDGDGASIRVYRGGHWGVDSGSCRVALRHSLVPSYRGLQLGLRLARVPSVSVGK